MLNDQLKSLFMLAALIQNFSQNRHNCPGLGVLSAQILFTQLPGFIEYLDEPHSACFFAAARTQIYQQVCQ